jgi:hypothetical protein
VCMCVCVCGIQTFDQDGSRSLYAPMQGYCCKTSAAIVCSILYDYILVVLE